MLIGNRNIHHTGIDQFLIEHLPKRLIVSSDGIRPANAEGWLTVFRDEALSQVRIGPIGYQWITGMYRAIAALVEEDLNVIVDDVIYDRRVLKIAVQTLPALLQDGNPSEAWRLIDGEWTQTNIG